MNHKEPTIDEIAQAVLLTMKSMSITDFGRKAGQVLGVYIEPAWSEQYVTAEVDGIPRPLYFKVRKRTGANNGKLIVEMVDFFVPGPSAPHTTWINPDCALPAGWN